MFCICVFLALTLPTLFSFLIKNIARFGDWLGFYWKPGREDIRIDVCVTWIKARFVILVENMGLTF